MLSTVTLSQLYRNMDTSVPVLNSFLSDQNNYVYLNVIDNSIISNINLFSINQLELETCLDTIFQNSNLSNRYFYIGKISSFDPINYDSHLFLSITYVKSEDDGMILKPGFLKVFLINIDKKSGNILSTLRVLYKDFVVFTDYDNLQWSEIFINSNHILLKYYYPADDILNNKLIYKHKDILLDSKGYISIK